MSNKSHRIKVGISIGDYNGIGPEVIIKSLRNVKYLDFFTPVIFGSAKLFSYQRSFFKIQQNYHQVEDLSKVLHGKINMVNVSKENFRTNFGNPDKESAKLALLSLEASIEALIEGKVDILVTAPISKEEMKKQGFSHIGHTDYLEEKFKGEALMLLVADELKVAVSTHHIPLSEIPSNISTEKIEKQIKILINSLKEDFFIEKPKVAVLGLNPHAGDGGAIGKEEVNILIPLIEKMFEEGYMVFGPYPSDSFFQPEKYSSFDAVLAMYHDQGLIPFKTIAYEEGVNYTAGLPIIRTSPDHGVAYDIAGKNLANEHSFSQAIFTGIKIFKNRIEHKSLLENSLKIQGRNALISEGEEDFPEEKIERFVVQKK